jgi:hypothetical protein
MSNETTNKTGTTHQVTADNSDRVSGNFYDPNIIPTETAARMEREGDNFKRLPTPEGDAAATTDDQTDNESIRTTDGYTMDKEGSLNNYAVEPEMYYEVPGDARQQAEAERQARAAEYAEINEEQDGKLTMEDDRRGKGPGIV